MSDRKNVAALVWAPEENRTEQIARHLDAHLHTIHYLYYKRPFFAPFKYVPQTLKTLSVLRRQRAKVVYATNPPVFAVLAAALYCWRNGATYVMDTHSPALYSRKWSWTVPLQRFLARRALLNVVDQRRYKALIESWGGRALVLEKPIAENVLGDERVTPQPGSPFTVTVINTFAVDEPLEPVLEAARRLPDVCFVVLGNTSLADKRLLASAPANVSFPGYLLKENYWRQLAVSRAVMALTTYPFSLLAGGHDGLSLGKPLILSDQPALTDFYTKSAVFTDNTAESLVAAVQEIQQNEQRYIRESHELAAEKRELWQASFAALNSIIEEAASG